MGRRLYYTEPGPLLETWVIDVGHIGVRCQEPGCGVEGVVRTIDTEGDINVDADLTINGAWCGAHLPERMRKKSTRDAGHERQSLEQDLLDAAEEDGM